MTEGEEPAGSPTHNRLEGNTIRGNRGPRAKALRVEAQGAGNVFIGNVASDNTDNALPQ